MDLPSDSGRDGRRAIVPFAVVAAGAFVLIPAVGGELGGTSGICALALTVVVGLSVLAPWSRLGRGWRYVPPLIYIVVVALMREAAGDAGYVFVPLILLPVLWIAQHGSRRELIGILFGAMVCLAAPHVFLGHPASDAGLIVLVLVIATLMGIGIQTLVASLVEGEAAARRSEHQLTIATGAIHEATVGDNPRPAICEAARHASGGDVAILMEPDDAGDVVATAAAGIDIEIRIRPGKEPSGTVIALTSGRRYFVADAKDDPTVSTRVVKEIKAVSLLFEPVFGADGVLGVLIIGWRTRVADENQPGAATVRLLAAQAAGIIERADLIDSLANLARTDSLTGLLNRRSWDEMLDAEASGAGRTGRSFSILMIDLDGLKQVNDREGHPAGDRLLKSVASALSGELRQGDNIARVGGDEFGILLPESNAEDAARFAGRAVKSLPGDSSCSVGIATYKQGEDLVSLIARADDALYRAKSGGGGRISI